MQQKTLWSKMTGWIKPGGNAGRSGGGGGHASQPSSLGFESGESTSGEGATADLGSAGGSSASAGGLSKWRRSDPAIEKLQEGHAKVIELIDSIQQHQERQDTRAAEISSTLSQIGRTLEDMNGGGQEQARHLTKIADALQLGNERTGRWDQAIAELPKLAESQREALSAVAVQMEAAGERESRMSGSLDSFREAVTSLGDATTSSSVAVKNLQMTTLENHDRVAALMREQNKRFTMLFVVTLALVLIAIVTGMVALFRG